MQKQKVIKKKPKKRVADSNPPEEVEQKKAKKEGEDDVIARISRSKMRDRLLAEHLEEVWARASSVAGGWEEFDRHMKEGFCRTVRSLLRLPLVGEGNGSSDPMIVQLREVISGYDDLKYYTFTAAASLVTEGAVDSPSIVRNILTLLRGVAVPVAKGAEFVFKLDGIVQKLVDAQKAQAEAESAGLNAKKRNRKHKGGALQLTSPACFQRLFAETWLGVLALPQELLTKEGLLEILEHLHEDIMPFLASPLVLFDFLAEAYKAGGLAGILSLNSLFILMTQYGLEYPAFFENLYALFTADVCRTRYRHTFFDLLGKFLRSVGLSGAMVGAFAKRACRLSLHAPTPAVFFLISLFKALLIKNPGLMVLIHRDPSETHQGNDPYDADEPDPEKSNALESSCWELRALCEHFNPTVAATARELKEELKQPLGGTAPLLTARAGRTYSRMIIREVLRDIKGVPSVAYRDPVPFSDGSKTGEAVAAAFTFESLV